MIEHPAFPVDGWSVRETAFAPELLPMTETVFSLANGYLGLRGNHDEGTPTAVYGTYINGVFESRPIVYGERAYGYASHGQTILNVTDAKIVRLTVDGEPFDLARCTLERYERRLDLRSGTVRRELVWVSPRGARVAVRSCRLVSLSDRQIAALSYEVEALDQPLRLALSSELLGNESDQVRDDDPRETAPLHGRALLPLAARANGTRLSMVHRTARSGIAIACAAEHVVLADGPVLLAASSSPDKARLECESEGRSLRLIKFLAYDASHAASASRLIEHVETLAARVAEEGVEELLRRQRQAVSAFWEASDVVIEGDPAVQQAVRFNLFEVLQATALADGLGIPAKGLTGQGYEGHTFWDTEIYLLPQLAYTEPQRARNALLFRHRTLDNARARARALSQRGALFPWRTIDGEEASAYYPAGTAQYHIDADIAHAVKKYVETSGDVDFLVGPGAEMLVETARLFADLGFYSVAKGKRFHIHEVTGPDEYTALVDNNLYTNVMAQQNLEYAAATVDLLRERFPERYDDLRRATGLEQEEPGDWRRAAAAMHIPFDADRGIHPQDDTFLEKEPWDFAATPPGNYPLLLHYHPLVIYRRQVLKQPDVVLAMLLRGDCFTAEEKRANFDYYDPLTTDDSSLAPSVRAVIATEVGDLAKAYAYFRKSALIDLDNIERNTRDGVHIAAAAGAWIGAVYGFAGLRDANGELSFHPCLPPAWSRLRFRLRIREAVLEVDLRREFSSYLLAAGERLSLRHRGEPIELVQARPLVCLPAASPPAA